MSFSLFIWFIFFPSLFKRVHKENFSEMLHQIEAVKVQKRKQKSLDGNQNASKKKKQEDIDRLLTYFVSDALVPFKILENPYLREILNLGFPNKTLMDRKQCVETLVNEYKRMKEELTENFNAIKYVCITSDLFSIFHR